MIEAVAQGLLNGLLFGSIIALIATGLNLEYGVSRSINLVYGEVFSLGGFLAWIINDESLFPIGLLVSGAAGFSLSFLVARTTSFLGILGSRLLLFTLGLAVIMESLYLEVFGPESKVVKPVVEGSISIYGLQVEGYRLIAAVFAWAVISIVHLTLYKTRRGLVLVASMGDKELASYIGVNVKRSEVNVSMLSGSITCMAGFVSAPIIQPYYLNGLLILVLSLIVVVAGGLGNLIGGLVASMLLYSIEGALASAVVEPIQARVLTLLTAMALAMFRHE